MPISPEHRAQLVSLARATVAATIQGHPLPHVERAEGVLAEHRGCFVTLTNRGRLRGCIGTFHPDRPLGQMVVQMGAAAAQDGRFIFNPITPDELAKLTVEVSVLSLLEETTAPEKLEIGRHGIYIVQGRRSGCFLPEVAVEAGWDAAEFLSQCCAGKAGMEANAWRLPGTKVFLFTSEKFDH